MKRSQPPFDKAPDAIRPLISTALSPSNAISESTEISSSNDVHVDEKGDGMDVEQSLSSLTLTSVPDHPSNKRSLDDEETSGSSKKTKTSIHVDSLTESDLKQQQIIEKLRSLPESEFMCEPWRREGAKLYAVDRVTSYNLSAIMGRINKLELRLFNDKDELRENVSMNEMMDRDSRRQLLKDVEFMREKIDAVDWSSVKDPWSTVDEPIINLNTFCRLTLSNTRTDAGFVVKAAERIEQCSLIGRLSGMNARMYHLT